RSRAPRLARPPDLWRLPRPRPRPRAARRRAPGGLPAAAAPHPRAPALPPRPAPRRPPPTAAAAQPSPPPAAAPPAPGAPPAPLLAAAAMRAFLGGPPRGHPQVPPGRALPQPSPHRFLGVEESAVARARPAGEVAGRPVLDDPPALDHHHPREAQGLAHVVCD